MNTRSKTDKTAAACQKTPDLRVPTPEELVPIEPQAQHSPLPWRSFTRYVMSNGRFLATAHAIGDQASSSNGFAIGQEPTQDMNEAEANAKLIVHAVNHAGALAEALRAVRDAYQQMFDVMPVAWQTYDHIVTEALARWEAK